jgi:hexokinase
MGLVLGTGTNAAAYLPTSALGSSKFGSRGSSWFDKADKVITNTEVSMFGKGILPQTRWDETLNKQHKRPDFQPLEYMTTGRYLGELFRLVLIEAVQTGELFDGVMPAALDEPYSVDTELLARLEQDPSKDHQDSSLMIKSAFDLPVTPSETEISFLRTVATSISYRASAYTAVAVHALLTLQRDVDFNLTTTKATSKTSVACNGSVILKYPGFKDRCESLIEEMIMTGSPSTTERIVLQSTDEAAIFGAAVAVALADDW